MVQMAIASDRDSPRCQNSFVGQVQFYRMGFDSSFFLGSDSVILLRGSFDTDFRSCGDKTNGCFVPGYYPSVRAPGEYGYVYVGTKLGGAFVRADFIASPPGTNGKCVLGEGIRASVGSGISISHPRTFLSNLALNDGRKLVGLTTILVGSLSVKTQGDRAPVEIVAYRR